MSSPSALDNVSLNAGDTGAIPLPDFMSGEIVGRILAAAKHAGSPA
jgi:hypothetical protein